jgi:hypothetical protein
MDKIECTQLFAATIYNTTTLENNGAITPRPRMTVFSGRRMEVIVEPFTSVSPNPSKDEARIDAMLKAAGAKFRITIKPAEGATVALITKDKTGNMVNVKGYDRFVLFSDEDVVHLDEDFMPVHAFRKLAHMERPDTTVEMTPQELLESIKARVVRTGQLDEAHGFKEGEEMTAMLALTADQISAAVDADANMDDEMARAIASVSSEGTVFAKAAHDEGKTSHIINGEQTRFVPVSATDFKDAQVTTPTGGQRHIGMLRVAHVNPPEWRPATSEQAKKGVTGSWVFKTAAIGESLSDNVVSYTTVGDMVVEVRASNSINPAGQIAIPVEVWRSMMEDKDAVPATTMTEDEGAEFTKTHALTLAQSIASAAPSGKAN